MVDDSHAVGLMGATGKGTHEFCQVLGRVDIMTGTLGKALGGASGGYTSGKKEVIAWLRQRSRPYLFSNSLAPVITKTSTAAIKLLSSSDELRLNLHQNALHFRQGLQAMGFKLLPGQHPIIPVMLGEASLAGRMAEALLLEGIYVIGFSYPVVPHGQARIRTQMSAALTTQELDRAMAAFGKVGRTLGLIR